MSALSNPMQFPMLSAAFEAPNRQINYFFTSSAFNELTNARRKTFVSSGAGGIFYMYISGVSESDIDLDPGEFVDSEDDNDEEGVIWLKELCHLQNSAQKNDEVVKVEFMAGASRIFSLHSSGDSVAWCHDESWNGMWGVEFVIPGDVYTSKSEKISNSSSPEGTTTSLIAYDRDGNFSIFFIRGNFMFERYRRVLGHPWEFVQKNEDPHDIFPVGRHSVGLHSVVHIGKVIVGSTNGRGFSVLATSRVDSNQFSYVSDTAGYSPSTALFSQLLTGGRACQVFATLGDLYAFVRKVKRIKHQRRRMVW